MLCRIGDIEVWRILEINAPFRAPTDLFPEAGPDVGEIIKHHVPRQICADTGFLILPIQGFLLKTPSHTILVDSCVGNHKTSGHADWNNRSSGRFMAALTASGTAPEDVDYVLCTHLHTDHIGWNTKLENGQWVPTFPNAKYLIPEADNAVYSTGENVSYRESVLPVIQAGQAEMVSDGHRLGDYVTLIPTPGHTPGHVSVRLKDGDSQAIITGDAIHTTAQCAHPEWVFKYDMDAEAAKASRRVLLETAAQDACLVLGHHFALPSLGRIEARGDVFHWKEDV